LQLELSPIEFGVTYSALHGCALLTAVVVGLLCQRGAPPAMFTLTGLVCMIAGLFFIGPAAFIQLSPSVDGSVPE
jgi:multidrug transporter EmrE-like cation transporter